MSIENLKKLREEFPPHQISKLPKPTAKREVMDQLPKATCKVCGNYHATSKIIHLDYVGHAALTDRLLDTDPEWNWEPMGLDSDGLPKLDKTGGLWIRLTVCGVTRPGYGCADGKTGGDAMKEIIGDALRNAAMRFGAALDLWHKGDLHLDQTETQGNDSGEYPFADEGPKEFPWSDDDYTNAKNLIADLADTLLDRGVDESEIKAIVGKPQSTIGDTTIGFEKWANRLHAYSQRALVKYPHKAVNS